MQKQCLNDNCYNVTKQLAKTQQFLANISQYIEDPRVELIEIINKRGNMI